MMIYVILIIVVIIIALWLYNRRKETFSIGPLNISNPTIPKIDIPKFNAPHIDTSKLNMPDINIPSNLLNPLGQVLQLPQQFLSLGNTAMMMGGIGVGAIVLIMLLKR